MTDVARDAQTYLLTLASRTAKTKAIIVISAEGDGRFTHFFADMTSDFDQAPWVEMVGQMEAVKFKLLSNNVVFQATNTDGSPIVLEDTSGEDEDHQ